MTKRYFCVHGHFYQPPRENPWTETVERQPSARPEHDWNRRIARECYIPNTQARILNGHGRIVDLVNNYEHMSFNYGPTLMAWFQKAYPHDYPFLKEADRRSSARLGGHGNALAQAYNHMILPLCVPRDMDTQIRWGLADFRHRFSRKPEAMWIPETAVNEAVLKALVDHGMKYALLAPGQALRVRPIGAPQWTDVSAGGLDPRRVYRWSVPGTHNRRNLALFFYDGGLSHSVAFEKVMVNAKAWAGRISEAFSASSAEPQLVSICTDGESYGHHEHFGDMGLAHLLTRELPALGVEVVNYGHYLAKHPPQWEVELKPGSDGRGTSWSCAHGVARWTDACGCGAEGRQLLWRRPMREALDWLRDHLAVVYEREGGRIFHDPWQARDGYIDVILDRSEASVARFMTERLKVPDEPEVRQKALRLLEMQRNAMLMYTSCGWFFSDISGIEAVQNLQYAARAVELAREAAGVELEGGLTARLKLAPSNYPVHRDGEGVYRNLAAAGRVPQDSVAAHHAVSTIFAEPPQGWPLGHFQATSSDVVRHRASGTRLSVGRVTLRDGVTTSSFSRVFLSAALPDYTIAACVRPADVPQAEYDALVQRVLQIDGASLDLAELGGGLFPGKRYALQDLLSDEQERVLACIIERRRQLAEDMPLLNLGECLSLAEQHARIGLDLPPGLRGQAEAALESWLMRRAREFMQRPEAPLSDIGEVVARGKSAGLAAPSAAAEEAWESCFVWVMDGVDHEFSALWLKRLTSLARMAAETGLTRWRYRAQNRLFAILRRLPAQGDEKVGLVGEIDEAARLLEVSADV
ncbi:MAG TPA: glycoside hydrolase [Elusimicrobia bacterium]|nr:glycoside hydrolase [Elusimicrobiota bacterium]HBT61217.1 glycoside hydrolase [Elusimicrobiota bacterium]